MAVMGDVVILLCILLSVGSQLVGMLVPGWWVYPANDSGSINASTTTYGLWVTVICVEGDCNEIPTDTSGSNAWLQVTQVFESVAVGFCLLAAACLVVTNLRSELELFLLLRRLSVFLLAASATSVLIGMAVFLKKSSGLARYPLRSTFVGRLEWPIVSACLTVFVAVIIGDKLRRQHQEDLTVCPVP
ncbi:uncharacterized protein LOC112556947 [Pomacea canaliculata]|nr:uncharacterized protein LOC112556947 [Pomacea canaliculata]